MVISNFDSFFNPKSSYGPFPSENMIFQMFKAQATKVKLHIPYGQDISYNYEQVRISLQR